MEPVYIWFPFGLTYLVAIALGLGLGWGFGQIDSRVFQVISATLLFPLRWYRQQRSMRRKGAIDLDEAEKQLDQRRQAGD